MLGIRVGLALGMIVVGSVIVVRMFAAGLSFAILPGLALGGAMIALGVYRIKQLRAVTQSQ